MILTLRAEQQESLDATQSQRFRERLRRTVQQEYHAYAEAPPITMRRLIGIGLARAAGYGFRWQSSLGSFIYLMAAVAPNFDQHPAIHALLSDAEYPLEQRLDSLAERLPAGVWEEAAQASSSIGWYLSQDSFTDTAEQRICAALRTLFAGHIHAPANIEPASVKHALNKAEHLACETEDQRWIVAACCAIYGVSFDTTLPWAKQTVESKISAAHRVALLRIRLALDFGLWL